MPTYYFQLLIPLLCLGVNVILQVLSSRYISSLSLLKSVYLGFLSGFVFFLFCEFLLFSMNPDFSWWFAGTSASNLIIYFALGYCYFHFINLGETARRIRILREIYDSHDGLSTDGILERYNADEIVEKRLRRLINNGQIVSRDGRYYIGRPEVLLMANILAAMKLLLFVKKQPPGREQQ